MNKKAKWYKITREDGTSIYDSSFQYRDGYIVKLSDEEFNRDPVCGNGLHYGSIDSAVLDGLGLLEGGEKRDTWAVIPKEINFRVFEVIPLGEQIGITYDKYKTNKLATKELTPEEYLPLLLSSESGVVREVGAMKLAQQNEDIKKKLSSYLRPEDEHTNWLPRWDYLRDPNKFVGVHATTTPEYSKHFYGNKKEGEITSIDSNSLVATLDSIDSKVINLYWLTPARRDFNWIK